MTACQVALCGWFSQQPGTRPSLREGSQRHSAAPVTRMFARSLEVGRSGISRTCSVGGQVGSVGAKPGPAKGSVWRMRRGFRFPT